MAGMDKRAFVCAGFRQSQIVSPGGSCSTLAIRGPRDVNAEFSFGGGGRLPAGEVVGAGAACVGFPATAGAL